MNLVWGNALLFVCVVFEILITKSILKERLPWKEIILNLNSGLILMWIIRGFEIVVYMYILENFNLGIVMDLPYWSIWLIAFIVWDFCFYWLHRMHHFFPFLWGVHVVHHEGEHFSLSLGIRNSWYSSLTSIPFFVILAFSGVPIEIIIGISSIHYFIQFYNHNHLVKKSGFLERIMITPSHHRVHHGKNAPYVDRNFGGTFVFWDKLFGTFQIEQKENPVEFGVDDPVRSYNPVLVNMIPILKFLGIKISPKKEMRPIETPSVLLASGSFLLFVIFLYYVYFEKVFPSNTKLFLFSLVFLGTIGLGILSDGKRIGAYLWTTVMIAMPTAYLIFYPAPLVSFKVTLIISAAYGTFTLLWLAFNQKLSIRS